MWRKNYFNKKNSRTDIYISALFFLCLQFCWATPGWARDKGQESELQNVKQQIKSHQENIQRQSDAMLALERQLERSEIEISRIAAQLVNAVANTRQAQKQLLQLKSKAKDLAKAKQQQQGLLANQIASAYMAGHHDYLKVLLNQEDPNKMERAVSYYRYLNEARLKTLQQFQNTLAELEDNQQQQVDSIDKLKLLQQQKKAQQGELASQQSKRQSTLQKINSSIDAEKQQLKQLEQAEKHLASRIQQSKKKLTRVPMDGLNGRKGKLARPTKGRVKHSFGSRRSGQLRWKGQLISAKEGAQIKSISHGQVVYSDYLRGYGMVMVVDHGKGYMSLYGHNQTLLRKVGDKVKPGEVIALVGQSGGQHEAGLYFEIRYQGKPVDPKKWLKRR